MDIKLINGKSPIGETIRSVADAQASRLFKTELNTEERSALVFMVIRSEIAIALFDLGQSLESIINEIDPTDDVLAAMVKTGYKLSYQTLLGGGSNG